MKTTPMIFNQEMVKALVEGRKIVTRRPVKLETFDYEFGKDCILKPNEIAGEVNNGNFSNSLFRRRDLIWVRETFKIEENRFGEFNSQYVIWYQNHKVCRLINPTNENSDYLAFSTLKKGKTPSIHMPRFASRLTLRVTDVRVERVQNIRKKRLSKKASIVTLLFLMMDSQFAVGIHI